MYDTSLVAPPGSTLTLVAALWTKLCCEYRLMYEPSWLGVPIVQVPTDIVMMQELIWRVRPDVIVESGLAHGGSAILYASICELLGKGRVIGIDIDVRQHNRERIEGHPLAGRLEIIEGSSVDASTFERVRARVAGAEVVMVVLDSNHTRAHVFRELALYAELVTVGSYLVAMDGAQAHVSDVPRAKPGWKHDNPLQAIDAFLETHPEFRVDESLTRLHVTCCPKGFLQRLGPTEGARG